MCISELFHPPELPLSAISFLFKNHKSFISNYKFGYKLFIIVYGTKIFTQSPPFSFLPELSAASYGLRHQWSLFTRVKKYLNN